MFKNVLKNGCLRRAITQFQSHSGKQTSSHNAHDNKVKLKISISQRIFKCSVLNVQGNVRPEESNLYDSSLVQIGLLAFVLYFL